MNEIKKKSLYSWLLFDLANTVYAFVIPGLYFSVWLVSEQGWTDQALGLATSGPSSRWNHACNVRGLGHGELRPAIP